MGFRFSRRIRICKGVHLNVSKSGIGISLGMRGASISSGPRGTYVNMSLPGTGISYRQKIGNSTSDRYSTRNIVEGIYQPGTTFEFQIDDDGNETFALIDSAGNPFINDSLVRKIKRTPEYKEIVEKVRTTKNDLINHQNDEMVYIYKSTPKIITIDDVIKERDDTSQISQLVYYEQEFTEPEPRDTNFYDEAFDFAQKTVKTHKFWKKKELIKLATYKKMEELHKKAVEDWSLRKDSHYASEKQIKVEKDAEYKKEYEKKITERTEAYNQILNPTSDYLQDTVSDVLSQIELPVGFAIDYSVNEKSIELDIDLPEIEDFPQVTSSILQSGKLSIKKKTVMDLNRDYATSVVGMSFFFAGLLFNISPVIEKISISGYTQRICKETGNLEDQYVYSVIYTRDEFSKLNIYNIDPLEAIKRFDHYIDISSKFELKEIIVKQSEYRKSTADSQEIQTQYYRVEAEKKAPEKQVVVAQLDSASSSVIRKQENEYNQRKEIERIQRKNLEENKKIAKGCLIAIIVFLCFILGFCAIVASRPSKYSGIYNMKSGKYMK